MPPQCDRRDTLEQILVTLHLAKSRCCLSAYLLPAKMSVVNFPTHWALEVHLGVSDLW